MTFPSVMRSFRQMSRILNTRSISSVPLASTIHGDATSSSPHLVIAHGLFGQKQNFRSIAKNIHDKSGLIVHCVDLRNHGDSPHVTGMTYPELSADLSAYIREVLSKSGVKKVHLLGHSMGGKTVMQLALSQDGPQLIDKLIVEDASPRGVTTQRDEFLRYIKTLKGLNLRRTRRELLEDMEDEIPELTLRQYFLTNLQNNSMDSSIQEWKCNLDALESYVRDVLGEGMGDKDRRYEGVTLFLRGELSDFVKDSDEQLIRTLFPNVKFEKIPKARHWVHSDQPKLFVESVCRFLEV